MRTVYFGTSDFAVAVLERLAASAHAPALVVTRPDRPQGRGRRLAAPPVAVRARELGLPVVAPEALDAPDVLERIEAAAAEAMCVCAFGVLIREPLLSREIFNVHPSLLPRWRGAAPIERAIMAGDAETGVSIMRLTAGLDAGPVALRAAEPIRADDDYGTLAARLRAVGGELLVRALDERPPWVEQDDAQATYAEKLTAADRTLDPRRDAATLARVVRALRPHVGARLALEGGELLGVVAARAVAAIEAGEPGHLRAEGERLLLACSAGGLELLEVQPPGGRPMPAAAWLRGRPEARAGLGVRTGP